MEVFLIKVITGRSVCVYETLCAGAQRGAVVEVEEHRRIRVSS